MRLELDAVGQWAAKASAHGRKPSDGPDNARNDSAMRLFVMLLGLAVDYLPSEAATANRREPPYYQLVDHF